MQHMKTESMGAKAGWKELDVSYDDALARLPDALKQEGFGIITQIDIQETFKAKLGVDFQRYKIFGACNPSIAHTALMKDPRVGVLLPCNVVVYETDKGRAVLGAVDPMQTLATGSEDPALIELARDVAARLARVLEGFSSSKPTG